MPSFAPGITRLSLRIPRLLNLSIIVEKTLKGWNYSLFDFFGGIVFSANGEGWSRQRKITAPCFNEKISGTVWNESVKQAREMLQGLEAWRGGTGGRDG